MFRKRWTRLLACLFGGLLAELTASVCSMAGWLVRSVASFLPSTAGKGDLEASAVSTAVPPVGEQRMLNIDGRIQQ